MASEPLFRYLVFQLLPIIATTGHFPVKFWWLGERLLMENWKNHQWQLEKGLLSINVPMNKLPAFISQAVCTCEVNVLVWRLHWYGMRVWVHFNRYQSVNLLLNEEQSHWKVLFMVLLFSYFQTPIQLIIRFSILKGCKNGFPKLWQR